MTSPPWSVNCVKAGESELCLSLPKVIIHYAESRRVWLLSESLWRTHRKSADPILSFSIWLNRTRILQNCNKSLYNELLHIFTTSLTGFSTSSNQNPNLHKVPKFDVKRGCRTNKIQCSKSLLLCWGKQAKQGRERQKRRERQTERALIKHDCMIFQPQRGEHRKAHSQSSSWGSAQGEGNSNL